MAADPRCRYIRRRREPPRFRRNGRVRFVQAVNIFDKNAAGVEPFGQEQRRQVGTAAAQKRRRTVCVHAAESAYDNDRRRQFVAKLFRVRPDRFGIECFAARQQSDLRGRQYLCRKPRTLKRKGQKSRGFAFAREQKRRGRSIVVRTESPRRCKKFVRSSIERRHDHEDLRAAAYIPINFIDRFCKVAGVLQNRTAKFYYGDLFAHFAAASDLSFVSAASRSAIISSGFSSPTESRTSPSVIPAATRCSFGTSPCVIEAGCVISVSAEPRFSASEQSRTEFITSFAASNPPRTSNAISPPPADCWRFASSNCGNESSHG